MPDPSWARRPIPPAAPPAQEGVGDILARITARAGGGATPRPPGWTPNEEDWTGRIQPGPAYVTGAGMPPRPTISGPKTINPMTLPDRPAYTGPMPTGPRDLGYRPSPGYGYPGYSGDVGGGAGQPRMDSGGYGQGHPIQRLMEMLRARGGGGFPSMGGQLPRPGFPGRPGYQGGWPGFGFRGGYNPATGDVGAGGSVGDILSRITARAGGGGGGGMPPGWQPPALPSDSTWDWMRNQSPEQRWAAMNRPGANIPLGQPTRLGAEQVAQLRQPAMSAAAPAQRPAGWMEGRGGMGPPISAEQVAQLRQQAPAAAPPAAPAQGNSAQEILRRMLQGLSPRSMSNMLPYQQGMTEGLVSQLGYDPASFWQMAQRQAPPAPNPAFTFGSNF